MQELNKSLMTLSMLMGFGLTWYQFGFLWAFTIVAIFVILCMYLAYKCAVVESQPIIIIHPDVREMMKDEESRLQLEVGAKQYNDLMSHYQQKYEISNHRQITQDELSDKLHQRILQRESLHVHRFKQRKEIELLDSWLPLKYEEGEKDEQ